MYMDVVRKFPQAIFYPTSTALCPLYRLDFINFIDFIDFSDSIDFIDFIDFIHFIHFIHFGANNESHMIMFTCAGPALCFCLFVLFVYLFCLRLRGWVSHDLLPT